MTKTNATQSISSLRTIIIETLRQSFGEHLKGWHRQDFEIFLEIEAILYLHHRVMASQQIEQVDQAWALVSGYFVPGLNDTIELKTKCLCLRATLRYIKTASAWKTWLRWYRDQSAAIRDYDVRPGEGGTLSSREKQIEAVHHARQDYYAALLESDPAKGAGSKSMYAKAGTYRFAVDESDRSIDIDEALAQYAEQAADQPIRAITERASRSSIVIDLAADDLRMAAQRLTEVERAAQLPEARNWVGLLDNVRLMHTGSRDEAPLSGFTIDGLFHLVGMLGAGKSSLIRLLTYYLASERGLHVTVVMNTVVEAIRFADWLRRVGVTAAPALGRSNRADQIEKYGLANAAELNKAVMFLPNPPNIPALQWLVTPCTLSGSQSIPIPIGQEPCFTLMSDDGNKYRCPLLPVCPVHQVSRDLVESQVWVVNPWSLLYSTAPDGVGDQPMALLDAVYHVSDLLIVDEVDRVQVQWDNTFAATRQLVGGDKALLDTVHRQLGTLSVGTAGRSRAAWAQFNWLTNIDGKANAFANHVFRLIAKAPKLAKWIDRRQLTNADLYWRFAGELTHLLSKDRDPAQQDEFKKELDSIFSAFWRQPFRSQGGKADFLTEWVNRLVGSDATEKELIRDLSSWLADLMGWSLPLKDKRQRLMLYKLDFALSLTAMLKYTSDLSHLLTWAEQDLGAIDTGRFGLRDSIIDLVPEPPLGTILGVRYSGYENTRRLGLFNMLAYQGIGRWLLVNFPNVYLERTGKLGPHMLLTSATSWLPGSAQFHLAVTPNAVLLPPTTDRDGQIDIMFRPIRLPSRDDRDHYLKVSGAKNRERNLRQMVKKLATKGHNMPSVLEAELQFWRDKRENGIDGKRRILLVVVSYEQANWVLDELNKRPEWQGRAIRLIPDNDPNIADDTIRARQVESLHRTDADILIAPLMAIQRGFNILDEENSGALLGTAYFLVRPYPPPDDLSPQVLSMNAWMMTQLDGNSRRLKDSFAADGIGAVARLRRTAFREWERRLCNNRYGIAALDDDIYREFLRDQFVVMWQTVGRLLRGGRDARVIFVDGSFSQPENRRMLIDWYAMLDKLMQAESPRDRELARSLYGRAWDAFRRANENGDIF